jgi:hypothetical protein
MFSLAASWTKSSLTNLLKYGTPPTSKII